MNSISLNDLPPRGDLGDVSVPSLLSTLARRGFTGIFLASGPDDEPETTREIQFSGGHIAWAISTVPDESLRAFLVRSGAVTAAQWEEAEEKARQDTLRQTLCDLGFIERDDLTRLEVDRVEEIVRAVLRSTQGEYRLRERELPPGTPDLEIHAGGLVLDAVVETGDRSVVGAEVPSLDAVFRPVQGAEPAVPRGEYMSILAMLDGRNSVGQICAATSLPETYVCSVVAGLRMAGLVEPAGSAGDYQVTDFQDHHDEDNEDSMTGRDDEFFDEQDAIDEIDEAEDGTAEPEPVRPPLAARQSRRGPIDSRKEPASLYDDEGGDEASRPWFLLGGAAAVGFVALFLVLMSQGRGDAEGLAGGPRSEVAAMDPTGGDGDPAGAADAADSIEETDPYRTTGEESPRQEAAPGRQPESSVELPAVGQDKADPPEPPAAGPGRVSPPPPAASVAPADLPFADRGRQSLLAGDYPMAARHFGRHVTSRPGGYTIQVAMACQDQTVERLVQQAGRASDLFILATQYRGQECYRVYWGQYGTENRAREALRTEIPAPLRSGQNKPWVTRLP